MKLWPMGCPDSLPGWAGIGATARPLDAMDSGGGAICTRTLSGRQGVFCKMQTCNLCNWLPHLEVIWLLKTRELHSQPGVFKATGTTLQEVLNQPCKGVLAGGA